MNAPSRFDRLLSVPEQRSARLALQGVLAEVSASDNQGGLGPSLLFLHGPSGGGKTCLVQWLAEQATLPASSLTASIMSADGNFKSERSTSGASKKTAVEDEPDLLIVEDLQFLSPSGVETFLQRLDERQAHRRPTVVTASAGPRHLRFRGQPFPARLTSRLAAGLVVAAPLPQASSRRFVLDELLREAKLIVPESVVAYLADHGRGFRSLEGAVHQLELLAKLGPSPFKAAALLEHFQKQACFDQSSVERIVQLVAGRFQVAAKDVRSRSRRRGFVVPRHVSMYLARRLTPLSLQQIGSYFGGCDHATVLHAYRKMEQTQERDPELGGAIRQLLDDLA